MTHDLLAGEKVRLRRAARDDADLFYRWHSAPSLLFLTVDSLPVGITRAHAQQLAGAWNEAESHRPFIIVQRLDDRPVGAAGFKPVDWKNRRAEIFIYLGDENVRGQGLAGEALCILVRLAFLEMALNRLELQVFAFNKDAINLYERAGFRHEGRRRGALFRKGAYHDILMMGLLRDEWAEPVADLEGCGGQPDRG